MVRSPGWSTSHTSAVGWVGGRPWPSTRLIREGVVSWEGNITSLRRFKDDVGEVREGFECGIGLENFNDLKVGDQIEAYIVEKVAATEL